MKWPFEWFKIALRKCSAHKSQVPDIWLKISNYINNLKPPQLCPEIILTCIENEIVHIKKKYGISIK
jgi:hypothetical protein